MGGIRNIGKFAKPGKGALDWVARQMGATAVCTGVVLEEF